MSGLAARLPLALVLAAARSLLTGQPIGGRWFGGIGGVPSAQRQLSLQIGDLPFGVRDLLALLGDLLISFEHLLAEFLNLMLLPLDLLLQFLPAGRMRVRMPTGGCLPVACASGRPRTHPPYIKRFGEICPAPASESIEIGLGKSATITFTPVCSAGGFHRLAGGLRREIDRCR